ncbi:methyltransferase domain-containing protein [Microbacterium invictum]|uniref:2-polyprenyl-3-methyl-5-hydroxy-6-metoxy-1, 4-benzoquinol methylase n=1 Tax=Microbacterium invictum TaxID=515415 RepID=A0AA40SS59_9MICO|nr:MULTISPECIES: methyltransferase domain-containing protein [Microbacterium]MBB4141471.1 2-polyprenyl-3-methyl-5-hydroxy-6-metoxy-1,4-benzoquinol methylase [Microbacterium invictum]
MSLAVRDETLTELMDDPDCDPDRLRATLRRFDLVNRLVSGWGAIYQTVLRPYLAGLDGPGRVLDLGSGGGDLVCRLAELARRDGLDVHWVGADPDPRAHEVAIARESAPEVSFRCVDAGGLVEEGEQFDLVVSNHVLHHLGSDLDRFCADSRALAKVLVVHGDIARNRLAYGLYATGILPLAPGTFLLTDGLRSIRRSYTPDELQDALNRHDPGAWSVRTAAPFHLLAIAPGAG